MTTKLAVNKCRVCGNIVEIVHEGGGRLVCCDQPMQAVIENTVDASKEKHVPVITKLDSGYQVRVGSVTHPMEEKHYIEWIELLADGVAYRRFLKPGDAPEAVFQVRAAEVAARAYCNLHGLWKG